MPNLRDGADLLGRAIRYVSKGLEKGAYAQTVGGDLVARRLLQHARDSLASPRRFDVKVLLERAAKYVSKGLEQGAYVDTVGGDLFAKRLLDQVHEFLHPARASVGEPRLDLEAEIAAVVRRPGR